MSSRNEIGDANAKPLGERHPWWKLEEFKPDGGMWTMVRNTMTQFYADRSAQLMANPRKFADAMRRAIKEWPNSCENALATPGLNLRAWFGHAGCFLAVKSPEETTRLGWHQLDDAEQYAANAAADQVIGEYRRSRIDPAQDMLWEGDYA